VFQELFNLIRVQSGLHLRLISSNLYDTPEDSDHRRPRIEWVKLVDAKTHVWACGVFNRCQQMSAVLMTKIERERL